ncbi:MAG: hypothetical protein M1833_003392 [Piccolia ochrophora]|nr:MAG: hypothetical protein M1833_003392 [Piccolia ochrophora]
MASSDQGDNIRLSPRLSMLESLPNEIQHNILDFLSAPLSHIHSGVCYEYFEADKYKIMNHDARLHPFYFLAAVSRHFNGLVETYSRINIQRCLKTCTSPKSGTINGVRKRCAFCGAISKRRAIFNSNLFCCKVCDANNWDLVTMTDAITKYHVPRQSLFGQGDRSQLKFLPRRACFMSTSGWTTMFMKDDIIRLAELLHGDLNAFKKEREAWLAIRKKKMLEKAEARKAAEAAEQPDKSK